MLLKLENIGKIYNSDDILVVGIRGVNLEFDYNEFVTIEGESGSGKSTLLNVIGANDTYEEGELWFNDEETSHFSDEDWEKYRENNIATIFQDFNVIENITVLENVELALFRLDDKKERRKVALDLIEKVGLIKQANQRASKLSGGEKQRTVIARALAKDSPIILADEPTGNLDVKSSREIAALLRDVAKDKLVIVVTHNPEFFEKYATRRIRIFNGKVSEDNVIEEVPKISKRPEIKHKETTKLQNFKNMLHIGALNYKSRPKFTLMMTFALFVCAITLFIIMSFFSSSIIQDTKTTYDVTPIEGKVIVTTSDKDVTLDKLDEISSIVNPNYILLDKKYSEFNVYIPRQKGISEDTNIICLVDPNNYPLEKGEATLVIPYSREKDAEAIVTSFTKANCGLDNISVVKTMQDNEIKLYISLVDALNSGKNIKAINSQMKFKERKSLVYKFQIDDTLEDGYINIINSVFYDALGSNVIFEIKPDKSFTIISDNKRSDDTDKLIIEMNKKDFEEVFSESDNVSSACLYFSSDKEAQKAIKELPSGYMGMLSTSSSYVKGVGDVYTTNLLLYCALIAISILFAMLIVVIFMRSVKFYQQDFAVYKTLGISKVVSSISLYIEMLFIFLPTLVLLPIVSMIATIMPSSTMTFISAGNYVFIEALLLFIVEMVAYSFNKGINKQSIRKSLKRGSK